MGRFSAVMIIVLVASSCNGDTADTTRLTSTTIVETTTSFFPNPFLDVVDEPSNFSAGDEVSVVGLPSDEQAWVGSFPADDVEFFGGLWPFDRLDAGLVAIGEAASYLGRPIWERVEREGQPIGFIPQARTGVLGPANDITEDAAELQAASADELLALVAETIANENGLEPIQITTREFGGREVYFDLMGGGDPTSRGIRIRVVVEEGGDGFSVVQVESRDICVSGITDAGACS